MKTSALLKSTVTGIGLMLLTSCGGSGVDKGGKNNSKPKSSLAGSIQSTTGSTADYEGWLIALVDKATGESRVAEINALGSFSFAQVSNSNSYTLVLLNTDFRLASVLSMVAADNPGKVYQWFQAEGSRLPRIIHKGPAMEFNHTDSVTILSDLANDKDGNGVPDGMDTTELSFYSEDLQPLVMPSFAVAGDSDENDRSKFADIDKDGLPNWFDDDDDGNGTLDIFDLDANGDLVLDSNQKVGDHYFGGGIEHIAVQVFAEPNNVKKAKFVIKLSEDAEVPTSVSVLGPTSLFDDSRIIIKGETGKEEAGDMWNRTLKDDGSGFDGSEDDGIYARKIKLRTGKSPKTKQVVFISVKYESYSREFPYTFPDVTLGKIDFIYTKLNRVVTKSGSPFGDDEESYLWTVNVFDDDGSLVHASSLLEGATQKYTIPEEDIDDASKNYTIKVFAQTLEKVSGYPGFIIESEKKSLD